MDVKNLAALRSAIIEDKHDSGELCRRQIAATFEQRCTTMHARVLAVLADPAACCCRALRVPVGTDLWHAQNGDVRLDDLAGVLRLTVPEASADLLRFVLADLEACGLAKPDQFMGLWNPHKGGFVPAATEKGWQLLEAIIKAKQ